MDQVFTFARILSVGHLDFLNVLKPHLLCIHVSSEVYCRSMLCQCHNHGPFGLFIASHSCVCIARKSSAFSVGVGSAKVVPYHLFCLVIFLDKISWHGQSKENFIRLPHLTCTGKVLIWVVSGLDKCQCPQNLSKYFAETVDWSFRTSPPGSELLLRVQVS